MPKGKYTNLSIRREVREELDKIREELKINDLNDLLILLVKTYREHTNIVSKLDEITNTISREITNTISKTISCVSDTHTNSVSKENTNAVSKSDEPKPRVFCKNKSEIRDINRYVKWLKENNKLIDWWDEGLKYCFEVKE